MKRNEGFMYGVNLGGWLSQCEYSYEHYDSFISAADIEKIASWGADHVRLPIDYDLVCNQDDVFIEKGFSYITKCIGWCRKNGLNMVLDLHKTKGYIFDDYENSGDFFFDQELQQKFINLWKQLAVRYGNDGDMLAFELLNEVVDPNIVDEWNQIASRAIKEIRAICPTIKILVGGVNYNSIETIKLLDLPEDDNLIYNFHCYEPFVFTHQNAYWVKEMPADFKITYPLTGQKYYDAIPEKGLSLMKEEYSDKIIDIAFYEKLFSEAIGVAEEKGVSLYCGEYGVIDKANDEEVSKWYQDICTAFEKNGIGSAFWNYKAKDFGVVERPETKIPFLTR